MLSKSSIGICTKELVSQKRLRVQTCFYLCCNCFPYNVIIRQQNVIPILIKTGQLHRREVGTLIDDKCEKDSSEKDSRGFGDDDEKLCICF